jgi:hypothetical protein
MSHTTTTSQREQRLKDLISRRHSLLTSHEARQHARITARCDQLDRDRETTQSQLDTLVRILGPQYMSTPYGVLLAPRINLADHVPSYIGNVLATRRMPMPSRRLVDHMARCAHESSDARVVTHPLLTYPYGNTGRVPSVQPVRKGQLDKQRMYGNWDMKEFEAGQDCARILMETPRLYLGDREVQAVELEILRLEREIGSLEMEMHRQDSAQDGMKISVEDMQMTCF